MGSVLWALKIPPSTLSILGRVRTMRMLRMPTSSTSKEATEVVIGDADDARDMAGD